MLKLIPTQTEDGSFTICNEEKRRFYRSNQGAVTESKHVFLNGTSLTKKSPPWSILELGLGGGLNFIVTANEFLNQYPSGTLDYHSIDKSPIKPELFLDLKYNQLTKHSELITALHQVFMKLQTSTKPTKIKILERISFTIYPSHWQELNLSNVTFDAIYHDPFGPKDNPECWTIDCFNMMVKHLKPDGLLATYAAASHIRQSMIQAGLAVARAPGSGRKREMTIAALNTDLLLGKKLVKAKPRVEEK